MSSSDSSEYLAKKRQFDRLLTIYGRKPVLEALQDKELPAFRLHLADTNQRGGIVTEIEKLAQSRGVDIRHHSRDSLSRISRNRKQDQGVALDLECPHFQQTQDYLQTFLQAPNSVKRPPRLLALCDIHNPQNLGMIIRSACAGGIDGILIPDKGCAPLSPLVIKASAGTLFKAPILKCETLTPALRQFRDAGFSVCVLSSHATESLFDYQQEGPIVYILGNESEGVSAEVFKLADKKLMIPMANNVESLNVAVTAALIAYSKRAPQTVGVCTKR